MTTPPPPLTRAEALHQQIARHVRNDVAAGVLRDGDVLPSTRELAERWQVSVFTITEAMKLLADEGLIVSKSRSKRVVRAPAESRPDVIRLARPHVILIGGYAGSGKSELGRILARETGWAVLDKDTLTRPLVEKALTELGLSPHDRESPHYLVEIRPLEYEALAAAIEENVQCGNSVIASAPFIREFDDPAWFSRLTATYSSFNADVTVVWVYCDEPTMHTYLRRRGAARDNGKLGDWPNYIATIDPGYRPPLPHIVVDNCAAGAPLQKQARNVVARVTGRAQ